MYIPVLNHTVNASMLSTILFLTTIVIIAMQKQLLALFS